MKMIFRKMKIWKQILLTPEQTDHKTACHTAQKIKSEDKKASESAKREGLSHYNTNRQYEQKILEPLHWHK